MSILKATRANYAALQHKPDGARVALDVCLETKADSLCWRFWVRVPTPAARQREITRAVNRVKAMYPAEWVRVTAELKG